MYDPQSHSPKKCRFQLQNSPKHAVQAQIRQEKHPKTAIFKSLWGRPAIKTSIYTYWAAVNTVFAFFLAARTGCEAWQGQRSKE